MSPNPVVRCLFALVLLGCWLTPYSRAQVPPYDPAQDATDSPLKSYHGLDIDSIDLNTGILTVKIPLVSYPQRGGVLHLDFALLGAVPGAVYQVYAIPHGGGSQEWLACYPGAGCGYPSVSPSTSLIYNGFPTLKSTSTLSGSLYIYQASVLESNGASHLVGWINQSQGRSLDGTGYLVNGGAIPYTITDSSGVRVSYSSGSSTVVETDPNGNQIIYSTTNGVNPTITDTLGRQIPAPVGLGSWNVPGINGGTENFQVTQPSHNLFVLTLPNLTSYSLQYTSFNLPLLTGQTTAEQIPLLTQVTLPTGGSISWTYSPTPVISPCPGNDYYLPVTSRSVNANDGTGSHTWTYSYSLSSTASGVTTVTDPLGQKTVYTYGLTSCKPYATQIQKYDSNNNLLQTSSKSYSYIGATGVTQALNVNLTSELVAWANGQQASTTYSYDRDNGQSYQFYTELEFLQSNGQFFGFAGNGSSPAGYTGTPWNVTASDYGNGAPGPTLRQTKTTYMAFNGPNAASYLANNILEKPYTIKILNGSGTQVGLTQYNYDENTPTASGLTSSNQWTSTPPAGAYRGNNTSVYRWLNNGTLTCPNGNSGGSASNVISLMTYYDGGMLHTSVAPCGNITGYSYSGNYWYAYPTSISNALNQSTSYVYDFNTGLVTSVTDPNNQASTYSYDSMWRLNCANFADGGQECTTHQESSFPFTSTFKKNITSSLQAITITTVDGLGRPYQTELTSDPDGPSYTSTSYDALGRISKKYNPTRCNPPTSNCGESTWGYSTTSYDALNRVLKVTDQDGSVATTSYSGNSTTVTDETGHTRSSIADGLGRLTQVTENPGGLGYITTYIYLQLNNTIKIQKQWSQ